MVRLQPLLLASVVLTVGACQDNYEMVTVALQTASDVTTDGVLTEGATDTSTMTDTATNSGTASGTGGESSGTSTAGTTSTGSTTDNPTAGESTTVEPAPCDTAPECTSPGDPDGDPGPTTVPFFRGRACVPKEVKPGQALPIRLEACLHPCLKTNAFSMRHAYRCPGGACEAAATIYYRDVVGSECPSDVFAKFDPKLCAYKPVLDLKAGPLLLGDVPFEGDAPVVIPYLSNEQMAEIDDGADSSAEIWARIDANTQETSRIFEVQISPDAADAPDLCDDPDLCECREVGF